MDANSGEPWSEMDISDPTNGIATAGLWLRPRGILCRGQVEVRDEVKKSSEIEQLPREPSGAGSVRTPPPTYACAGAG